mgnify:CR=1 FL=1|tara:strand:- start:1250 stop:1537 length:288 start_codon:yes stop_codon:yes gene_type:complete
MGNSVLRKAIREIIAKTVSENKDLTKEGVMDSVLKHISSVLSQSRDKRLTAKLDNIAKSSPAGKKAVADFAKRVKAMEDGWEEVQAMADDERSNW